MKAPGSWHVPLRHQISSIQHLPVTLQLLPVPTMLPFPSHIQLCTHQTRVSFPAPTPALTSLLNSLIKVMSVLNATEQDATCPYFPCLWCSGCSHAFLDFFGALHLPRLLPDRWCCSRGHPAQPQPSEPPSRPCSPSPALAHQTRAQLHQRALIPPSHGSSLGQGAWSPPAALSGRSLLGPHQGKGPCCPPLPSHGISRCHQLFGNPIFLHKTHGSRCCSRPASPALSLSRPPPSLCPGSFIILSFFSFAAS